MGRHIFYILLVFAAAILFYGSTSCYPLIAGDVLEGSQPQKSLSSDPESKAAFNNAAELARQAVEYFENGDKPKSTRAFQEALNHASLIKDQNLQFWTISDIAIKYAEIGESDQALSLISRISDPNFAAIALTKIALKCKAAGLVQKCPEILSQALMLAGSINNVAVKGNVLSIIAAKYAEAGFFDQALQVAQTINSQHFKIKAMAGIAAQYWHNDETTKSEELFKNTFALVDFIKDADAKALALSFIAMAYADMAEFDKASETAEKITDPAVKSDTAAYITRGRDKF